MDIVLVNMITLMSSPLTRLCPDQLLQKLLQAAALHYLMSERLVFTSGSSTAESAVLHVSDAVPSASLGGMLSLLCALLPEGP